MLARRCRRSSTFASIASSAHAGPRSLGRCHSVSPQPLASAIGSGDGRRGVGDGPRVVRAQAMVLGAASSNFSSRERVQGRARGRERDRLPWPKGPVRTYCASTPAHFDTSCVFASADTCATPWRAISGSPHSNSSPHAGRTESRRRAVHESAGGGVVVVASNGLAASAPVVYACGGGEGVAVVPGCEFGVSEVIRIQRWLQITRKRVISGPIAAVRSTDHL